MTPPEKEEDRESRILNEAVVDAHDEEERAIGWYYYLEERMAFPFSGQCRQTVSTSPLKLGEKIEILALADVDVCDHDMYVTVPWGARSLDVPLRQIEPIDTDDDTEEAIGDWHYWISRGYRF